MARDNLSYRSHQRTTVSSPSAREHVSYLPVRLISSPGYSLESAILHSLKKQKGINAHHLSTLVCEDECGRCVTISQPELREILGVEASTPPASPECSNKKLVDDRNSTCISKKRLLPSPITQITKGQLSNGEGNPSALCSPEDEDISDEEDDFRGSTKVTTDIRADDLGRKEVLKTLLLMLQQRGCRKVVGAWLKSGHQKKQAEFPFNGGMKAKTYADYDAENPGAHTAPPYWPNQEGWKDANSGKNQWNACRHKETDHIKRPERIFLMLHLLKLGDSNSKYHFDIDTMEQATKDITITHKDHFHPHAAEIIQSIYHVRRSQQRYENGECDGESLVHVNMLEKPKAGRRKAEKKVSKHQAKKRKTSARDNSMNSKASQLKTVSYVPPVANMITESASEDEENPSELPSPTWFHELRAQSSVETELPSRSTSPSANSSQDKVDAARDLPSAANSHSLPAEQLTERRSTAKGHGVLLRTIPQPSQSTKVPSEPIRGSQEAYSYPTCMEVAGPQSMKEEVRDVQFHQNLPTRHHREHSSFERYIRLSQPVISRTPAEISIPPNAAISRKLRLPSLRPSYSSSGFEGVQPPQRNQHFTPYVAPSQLNMPTTPYAATPYAAPATNYPPAASLNFNTAIPNDPDWLQPHYWAELPQPQDPEPNIYLSTADPGAVLPSVAQPSPHSENAWQSDPLNHRGQILRASNYQTLQAMASDQRSLAFPSLGTSGISTPGGTIETAGANSLDGAGDSSLRQDGGVFAFPYMQALNQQ